MAEKNAGNLEKLAGLLETVPFMYKPISPEEPYDRRAFLSSQGELNDLGEYRKILDEDADNLGARKDLCSLLFGDAGFHKKQSAVNIREMARLSHDNGIKSMAQYVERNLDDFLDILDGSSLANLALSMPLYSIGEEEHDSIVSIAGDIKSMQKAMKDGNIKEIRKIVSSRMKSGILPEWATKLTKYLMDDDEFIQGIFLRTYAAKNQLFMALISKEDEPDKSKLRALIYDSIDKAKDECKDEEDEDVREKLWKKALRPCYLAIAQGAYPIEKEEFEKEESPKEEKEKREREEERMNLGMPPVL